MADSQSQSPSRLARRLQQGHVVVTAELNPPRHAGADTVRRQAASLVGHVDAVNLTDCTRGIVRMSATAAALLVRESGVEPVVQMTCRDRNQIALQSELLGFSALGLHNVMLLTGDDPTQGDHPNAKPVFDLNGTSLLAAANGMRAGSLLAGRAIAQPPRLFLGAAGDPARDLANPDKMPLAEKADAGVDFVQTQPAFDLERFAEWMRLVRSKGLHERVAILAGVFILDSAQRAQFIGSVPGVVVPPAIPARLEAATDQREVGLEIAVELANALIEIEGVRGVHLMGIEATADMQRIVERSNLAAHVATPD